MGLALLWHSLTSKKEKAPEPIPIHDTVKYAPRTETVMTHMSHERAKKNLTFLKEAMESGDEAEVQIRQQLLANGGIEVPTDIGEALAILSKYP